MEIILTNNISTTAAGTALTIEGLVGQLTASGMSKSAIKQTLLSDLQAGGAIFGSFKNQLGAHTANGIERAGLFSTLQKYKDKGIKVLQWVTISDNNSCDDCIDRHNEEGTLKYWQAAGLPASGFSVCGANCRCTLVASGYKGENLDKPLTKQARPITHPSMAGKHKSVADAQKWAEKNSKGNGKFDGYKILSTKEANELNIKLNTSNKVCDKLGIQRIKSVHETKFGPDATMQNGKLGITRHAVETTKSQIGKNVLTSDEIFWHEFGHHLHAQIGKNLGREGLSLLEEKMVDLYNNLKYQMDVFRREILNSFPTNYSKTSAHEWFAENMMYVSNGYSHKVSKEFMELIDEFGITDAIK